jgi:hypothetical protein
MNFFKRLMEGSKKNAAYLKPCITSRISSNDNEKVILNLDYYICKLSSYGQSLENLTEPQKTFFFNQCFQKEISDASFNQYFFNSSGGFTHQTVIALRQINAVKTAEILQLAIDQFPNSIVPKNCTERQAVLLEIEDKAEGVWEQLEKRFYAYEDNLTDLNMKFIQQNLYSFSGKRKDMRTKWVPIQQGPESAALLPWLV